MSVNRIHMIQLILLFGLTNQASMGQDFSAATTARSQGLGGCRAPLLHPLDNPASCSGDQQPELFLSASNPYSVAGYTCGSVAYMHWRLKGTVTASLSSSGIAGFRKTMASLAAGRLFTETLKAGIRLEYLHISYAGEYPGSNHAGFSAGLLYQPIDKLLIGALMINPLPGMAWKRWSLPVSSYILGFCYQPVPGILLLMEAEKSTSLPLLCKAGAEATLNEHFFARIGYGRALSFGWGFHWKGLDADISASWHRHLGFSPYLSIGYDLDGKNTP